MYCIYMLLVYREDCLLVYLYICNICALQAFLEFILRSQQQSKQIDSPLPPLLRKMKKQTTFELFSWSLQSPRFWGGDI